MADLKQEPGYNFNQTEDYKLSIQISLDGFYFSVVNTSKNQLIALNDFSAIISSKEFLGRRFSEWVKDRELMQKTYAETLIVYCTENFTLVPSEFYDFEKQDTIAGLLFEKEQKNNILKDNYLPDVGCNLVYSVPESLYQVFNQFFPGHRLLHPLTVLSNKWHKLKKNSETSMVIFFGKRNFSLLLYKDGKFIANNSFSFFHPNDVLFYLLSILKQQNMHSKSTTLYLAGEIFPEKELHAMLKKYFSKTIFLTPEINSNPHIFREPLHRYIVLF
jgi:hypothetical protein